MSNCSKRVDCILKEIIESEHRYISQMEVAVVRYKQPFENDIKHVINEDDTKKMFLYYGDIIDFSKKLLNELKYYSEQGTLSKFIGEVFIINEERFGIYIHYFRTSLKRQQIYNKIINNLQQNIYLRSLQEKACKEGFHLQSLDSYFILPIQRLPRYQMLLIQLIQALQTNSGPQQLINLVNKQVRENDACAIVGNSIRKVSKLFNKKRMSICIAPRLAILSRGSPTIPSSSSSQSLSRNSSNQQLISTPISFQPNTRENSSQSLKVSNENERTPKETKIIFQRAIQTDVPFHINERAVTPTLVRESSAPSLREKSRKSVCIESVQNEWDIVLQECHEAIQIITTKTTECNRAIEDEEKRATDDKYYYEMIIKYQNEFNQHEKRFIQFEKVKWWIDDKVIDGNFVLLSDECFVEDMTNQNRVVLCLDNLQISLVKGGNLLELIYGDIDIIVGFADEIKWKTMILNQKAQFMEEKEQNVSFFRGVLKSLASQLFD